MMVLAAQESFDILEFGSFQMRIRPVMTI
jgi:hypothetical protein